VTDTHQWLLDLLLTGSPDDVSAAYAWLLECAPAYHGPDGWIVSRHADVDSVVRKLTHRQIPDYGEGPAEAITRHWLTQVDDAQEHARLRRLASKAFSRHAVEALRSSIRARVEDRLVVTARTGDRVLEVVGDFAIPIASGTICDVLGISRADVEAIASWAATISLSRDTSAEPGAVAAANDAASQLVDFLMAVIEERRVAPGEDVFSKLITARDEDAGLTDAELIGLCSQTVVAGHLTTVHAVGSGVLDLLAEPDAARAVAAGGRGADDGDAVRGAVEEILRLEPSVRMLHPRRLDEDVQIEDVRIPAGDWIELCIGAANRDPRVFDDPNRLRIDRAPNSQLAFSAGMHFCLGAHLARISMQEMIGGLFGAHPTLALDRRGYERVRAVRTRGLRRLWVTWT
jgi:cytochrome P450